MSFLNRIFRSRAPTKVKLIATYGNGFYSWNGKLYESDIIRSCIRPKAKAIGKLVAKHIVKTDESIQENPFEHIRFLLEEPNPLMCGQIFQERLATQLALNKNAFALIVRDTNGQPMQLYHLNCTTVDPEFKSGELYLTFYLMNGNVERYPYRDILHLREDFNSDDIFGDGSAKTLASLMNVVNTTDQGILKAIKNSAIVRWILKISGIKRKEDIEEKRKQIVEDNLSTDSNSGGVMIVDGTFDDVKQVDPKNYVPNAAQMDRTTTRIYNYFNTNEKIVQSKYNEDEWNAYYEAEIEPAALQMHNEYTRKLFTRKDRVEGNKIIFEAMNLQYASMKMKLELRQMVDLGAMTPNEWRQVFNLGPIEGGDKAIRRKDTGLVEEDD